MKFAKVLMCFTPLCFLAACASKNTAPELSGTDFCRQASCMTAKDSNSEKRMLNRVKRLFEENLNKTATICESNSDTGRCEKKKVCYVVIGGVLPGKGCASTFNVKEVASTEGDNALALKIDMPLSFIGTKVKCQPADATLRIEDDQVLTLSFSPYHCSWMVMGQMKARFEFKFDKVHADKEHLSGWWLHSVKGTGNGKGSGYATLSFGA